jgi:hypothetical protein
MIPLLLAAAGVVEAAQVVAGVVTVLGAVKLALDTVEVAQRVRKAAREGKASG